jgi:hypothetical protein
VIHGARVVEKMRRLRSACEPGDSPRSRTQLVGAGRRLDLLERRWQDPGVRTELAIVVVVGVGGTACAGGGDATPGSRAAAEACLREKGYRVEVWPPNELPFHGGRAAEGALRVESDDAEAGIAFNANADQARRRVEALETTASQWIPNPWFHVFERKGNVVYWARGSRPDSPRVKANDEVMNDVNDCLTA